MPKSQIIKDVVESSVSIEQSLTRLYVIAGDLNNTKLAQWATQELNGYKKDSIVPEYRKSRCFLLHYSGINCQFQVTSAPLPKGWLRPEIADAVANVEVRDGIRAVEGFASSESGAIVQHSELAGDISTATKGEVMCSSITQTIPASIFQAVCSEVKLRIITALTELEKDYGCLDDLGIDVSEKNPKQVLAQNEKLNQIVLNVNLPAQSERKTPWYSKVAWKIVIPIIVGVLCTVITALVIKLLGL